MKNSEATTNKVHVRNLQRLLVEWVELLKQVPPAVDLISIVKHNLLVGETHCASLIEMMWHDEITTVHSDNGLRSKNLAHALHWYVVAVAWCMLSYWDPL
jgi:hypothetical protein